MIRRCGEYWDLWEAWSTAEQAKDVTRMAADQALTALQLHVEMCPTCAEDWEREKALIKAGRMMPCSA